MALDFVFEFVHSNGGESQISLAEMHMETWDDLRFVAAVARAGSLSGAARALGVHHATVFRRLGAAERRLGVRLFERLAGAYVPTAAGQELAETAGRVEDDVAAALRRVAGRDLRLTGTLRFATVDTLANIVLPRHLAAFRAAHPGIALEVVISASFASLSRREADVALRATNDPPEALIGRRIGPIGHAIYGGSAHVNRAPAIAVADHDWLAPDDSLAGTTVARWVRRHVPAERIVLKANAFATLAALAETGLGVTVLPCPMADPRPGLMRLSDPLEGFDTDLWLLTHEDLKTTARVRAFVDFMATSLATERDRLAGRPVHHPRRPDPCAP